MEHHENQKIKLVNTHMPERRRTLFFYRLTPLYVLSSFSQAASRLSFSLTSSSAAVIFADIFMVALSYMPC